MSRKSTSKQNTAPVVVPNTAAIDETAFVVERAKTRDRCLSDLDAMAVAGAHVAVERYRDCSTPVEEFIRSLLVEYVYTDGALTLENVEREFEELKLNFGDMIRDAKRAARFYPELIAEQDTEDEAA